MPRELRDALRQQVVLRAQGRCEYCLYPEGRSAFPHQVDHIISRKHDGGTTSDNLAFCCIFCNRHKGSDVAAIDSFTGEPVKLFNPRRHAWADHFQIRDAIIKPLTPEGEATARILKFNHPERIAERILLQIAGQYPRGIR